MTDWDEETFTMLQATYPHKKDVDILRELMFQWRLKHENNDTKDGKLSIIIHLVNDLAEQVAELKKEVAELKQAIAIR
jgi:hypothetical protein